jgi:mannose-6-phosphate isomerase-like protein (cupin superfamily)
MNQPTVPRPAITSARGIATHVALGDELTVLLGGEQTGGQFMSAVLVTPPGMGPPPHFHEREDEWFVVIEGRIEFWVDGVRSEAGPGDCAYLPKGTPHCFRNIGDKPSRMILHTAPSGFEVFFADLAAHCAKGEPEIGDVVRICADHGIRVLPPG